MSIVDRYQLILQFNLGKGRRTLTLNGFGVKPILFQCSPVLKQRTDLEFVISMDLMYSTLLNHLVVVADNSVGQGEDSKCISSIEMERYLY